MSEAFADTVTVFWTVALFAGAVIETVGAVVSALLTVTLTMVDVVVLPAASRATAVNPCEPLPAVVVFQEIEYGAVVSSAPTFVPSTLNCTPATPTLSEAPADSVTLPETVVPPAGAVTDTVGGVVSATDPTAVFMSCTISAAVNARP